MMLMLPCECDVDDDVDDDDDDDDDQPLRQDPRMEHTCTCTCEPGGFHHLAVCCVLACLGGQNNNTTKQQKNTHTHLIVLVQQGALDEHSDGRPERRHPGGELRQGRHGRSAHRRVLQDDPAAVSTDAAATRKKVVAVCIVLM